MIVVLIVSGSLTSCSALGSLINNTTLASSFTAEDADIRQVEADYIALETELQKKVDHVKRDHPGYDEYNFTLAEISHNPDQGSKPEPAINGYRMERWMVYLQDTWSLMNMR